MSKHLRRYFWAVKIERNSPMLAGVFAFDYMKMLSPESDGFRIAAFSSRAAARKALKEKINRTVYPNAHVVRVEATLKSIEAK